MQISLSLCPSLPRFPASSEVCMSSLLVSLLLWAQSTTKDYIRAEHKLHSISKFFISQVIIPQILFFFLFFFFFFLAYLYSAGTQHGKLHPAGWPIYSAGLHRNHVLATANAGEIGWGSGKNAGEWTERVDLLAMIDLGTQCSSCSAGS